METSGRKHCRQDRSPARVEKSLPPPVPNREINVDQYRFNREETP